MLDLPLMAVLFVGLLQNESASLIILAVAGPKSTYLDINGQRQQPDQVAPRTEACQPTDEGPGSAVRGLSVLNILNPRSPNRLFRVSGAQCLESYFELPVSTFL